MERWTVQDRNNHTIYLTAERWQHIQERHDELIGRLDDVLDTLRYCQRTQEAMYPEKYRYRRPYDDLVYGFNHIVVIVLFRYDAEGKPNNFTVTAWGAYLYSQRWLLWKQIG